MLTIGDLAPNFVLPDQDGENVTLYGRRVAGNPVALAFCNGGNADSVLRTTLAMAHPDLDKAGIKLVLVNKDSSAINATHAAANKIQFPLLSNADGRLDNVFSINIDSGDSGGVVALPPPKPTIYLLNLNFRVIGILRFDFTTENIKRVSSRITEEIISRIRNGIPTIETQQMHGHPPILIIPDVFEPKFCERLVRLWEADGNVQSGIIRKVGNQGVEMVDDTIKVRRDHHVLDTSVLRQIELKFARRVVPEVSKCFNFDVSELEGIKIGCYEAETMGHFSAHRDNTSPVTANRRFAVTLNLNTGNYDGGHLWFPEYGPYLYSPPVGGAVIFSCSLLHEAKPITKGRRFVFVTFMYGKEDIRKHRAYLRSIGKMV